MTKMSELISRATINQAEAIRYQEGNGYLNDIRLESFGHLLEDYVLQGAAITIDGINVVISEGIISFGDQLWRVFTSAFQAFEPNKTYYIGFIINKGFVMGPTEPSEQYLRIWSVATNANGGLGTPVDFRSSLGQVKYKYIYEGGKGTVTTVNNVLPDANGNVEIETGGQENLGIVSVADFGASGNGSDQTVAIKAALASSKNVVIPDGVYGISQTIIIPRNTKLTLATNAVIKPLANVNVFQLSPDCILQGGVIDVRSNSSWAKACVYADGKDTFQPYEQLTIVRDINMKGIDYEHVSAPVSTMWKGTGIHFYSGDGSFKFGNGVYLTYLQVSNINMTDFYRGVHIEMEKNPVAGTPWITGCAFDQVNMMNCMRSIDITGDDPYLQCGHIFTGLQIQPNPYNERLIYCEASNCTFQGMFWDIYVMINKGTVPFEFTSIASYNKFDGNLIEWFEEGKHYIDDGVHNVMPTYKTAYHYYPPVSTNLRRQMIGDQDDILINAPKDYTVTKISGHTSYVGALTDVFSPSRAGSYGVNAVTAASPLVIEIDFSTLPIQEPDTIGLSFREGVNIPKNIKLEWVTASGGAYTTVKDITTNRSHNYFTQVYTAEMWKLRITLGDVIDTSVNRRLRLVRIFGTSISHGIGKAWLSTTFGGKIHGDVEHKGKVRMTGGSVIEVRTTDPVAPEIGQMWVRSDL